MHEGKRNGVPWCFDLYSQSTMTSDSVTPSALKFLRTANASCSLCTLRFDLSRFIVGENLPMPCPSTTWLSGFLKVDGVSRRYALR
jgi:hypothetical protein